MPMKNLDSLQCKACYCNSSSKASSYNHIFIYEWIIIFVKFTKSNMKFVTSTKVIMFVCNFYIDSNNREIVPRDLTVRYTV